MITIPGFDVDPQPAFRGQHSVTYRARLRTPVGNAFHQPRAIKVLEANAAESHLLEGAFKNAARAIARLGNTFGVPVIWDALRVEDGRLALVTTWVDGVGLGRALRDRFPDGDAPAWFGLGVGFELARLLEHAAARGVVHGDVRPRHVLVSEAGVWLADWAIDLELDRLGTFATGRLSPGLLYRAPERRLDRDVSPAADVYSLAAVVYRLLTGRLPFTVDTGHLWEVTPGRLPAELLGEVDTLVRRALLEVPARRPRAAELRAALQTAIFRLEPGYDASLLARACHVGAPSETPERERTRVLEAVAPPLEATRVLPSVADATPLPAAPPRLQPLEAPSDLEGPDLAQRLGRIEALLQRLVEADTRSR